MAGRHAQEGPPDQGGHEPFDDDRTQAMPQPPAAAFDDDRTQAMPQASADDFDDDRTQAMPRAPAAGADDDRTRAMPQADLASGDTRRWPADNGYTDDRTRVFATQPVGDDAPTTVIPGLSAAATPGATAAAGDPSVHGAYGAAGAPAPLADGNRDGDGTGTPDEGRRSRRWLVWGAIIVIVLLVIALVIALFALNGSGEDPAPTTTTSASATTEPTEVAPAPPAPPAPEPSEPEQQAAPEITAFEVSPTTVDCTAGGSVPLVFTWSSIDATEGWIGVGTNDAQAAPFDQISPGGGSYSGISFQCGTEQQTYALTVSGPGGTVSQTVTVTATSDDPADAGADGDGGDTGGEGDDSGTPPPGP